MKEPEFFVAKSVSSLQTMLRVIAECSRELPSVVPDGIYGANTMRTVQEFQRQNALPVTGVTNLETWEAVVAAYEPALVEVSQAWPLQIILDKQQVLLPGSRNHHVRLVQAMLLTLREFYPSLPPLAVTGVYDEKTVESVKWLQRANGLTPSGIFDKQSWKLLAGLYRIKTGNGENTNPPTQPG